MPRLPFRHRIALLALAFGAALSSPLAAQDLAAEDAGAFLAAKIAIQNADYVAAAEWHTRALLRDPGNPALLEGAILANIAVGDIEPATFLAKALSASGGSYETAQLVLIAADAKAENYQSLLDLTKEGASSGALLDSLVRGWAQVGLGQMSDATETFDKISKTKGLEAFGLYHKSLALAMAGDFGGADELLSGRAAGEIGLMRRGLLAHAQILSQLERNSDAVALLNKQFNTAADAELDDLRHRLTAGEPIPFTAVRNANDGMAEAFFDLAGALGADQQSMLSLIYARMGQHLRPDHVEVSLLIAGLLEDQGQHDLATAAYAQIPATSPMFPLAEIGRANATYAAGRKEAALEVLQGLSRSHPDILGVQVALGDTFRREERFAEARTAYDAAIALLPNDEPGYWVVYFSRGICAERLDDFAGAEADMRKALTLAPDEPRVLNYLGYSFVDRGEKLDEALGMIERAVAKEPGSGYIIDSLAWAYYRLGRYADAVEPMEKASLLEPVDPIVTDHLGDVYWAVGRTREAEFQWHRALSYGPEDKDATRIRAKLEKGLDAVLAEEGAKPIAPVEAKAND